MNQWRWNTLQNIPFISMTRWDQMGVTAAFSARQGGISQVPFDSLNLGLHVGDHKPDVLENRRRWVNLFSHQVEDMVSCEQVHGTKVGVVNASHAGQGASDHATALKGIDAMVTASPGLVLASYYADCFPLYFFHPGRRVVGLAHSGWKGTMGKIAAQTLQCMEEKFACPPGEVEVFIGPGIGPCCFQVDKKLAEKVKKVWPDFDIIGEREDKWYWDLPATNRIILSMAGVPASNTFCCPLCTCCHTDLFYSYRQEQGITGRMSATILIRN